MQFVGTIIRVLFCELVFGKKLEQLGRIQYSSIREVAGSGIETRNVLGDTRIRDEGSPERAGPVLLCASQWAG